MNKELPRMFDAETRLDKVTAVSGRMTYYFSFLNQAKENLALPVLQNKLRESLTANYRTNSGLAMDRKNDISMGYQYKDKNGELLFEIVVSPKDF